MPPVIVDQFAGRIGRNDSEYQISQAKWRSRPHWLEEVDGYRDRFSQSDAEVTRCYRCPWSVRGLAAEWLLGYCWTEKNQRAAEQGLPEEEQGILRRVIPAPDPERPWLFAAEAHAQGEGAWVESPQAYVFDEDGRPAIDPVGEDNPAVRARLWRTRAIHYVDNSERGWSGLAREFPGGGGEVVPPSERYKDGRALLRVTYRPRDYTVLPDEGLEKLGGEELSRYVTRSEDYALDALPLARFNNVLKFSEGPFGGQPVPEAGVILLPSATLYYTWHEVPDPPRINFYGRLGKVNSVPFDGKGGSPLYDSETLLCQPWKLERKCGPTGRVTWRVQYRFQFRPQGWNRFPASDGRFYDATFGGGAAGERVYKTANFHNLFDVPLPVKYIS